MVDDHTHLDIGIGTGAGTGDGDPPDIDDLLARARAANVPRAVQIGCDLPSARWTVDQIANRPELVGGVAIHPNEAPRLEALAELDDALAEVADLARHARVRVVGETGLDTFRTSPHGLPAQVRSFRAHIALAKDLDLPLQIHDRDAHAAVLEVLARDGAPRRTVFHCFSGDAAMARLCAEQGWYLSFAGTLTFTNAAGLREAARAVPQHLLQVETDAPFLTPTPHRGAPNGSYLLPHTVRALAEVRAEPLEELCTTLLATSEELYGPW